MYHIGLKAKSRKREREKERESQINGQTFCKDCSTGKKEKGSKQERYEGGGRRGLALIKAFSYKDKEIGTVRERERERKRETVFNRGADRW